MQHNRLVRDLLPSQLLAKGRTCTYHPAEDCEVQKYLLKTFFEEVKGFLNATTRDNKAEKLADLHEVMEHLMRYYDISVNDVRIIEEKKRQELGSFDQKIILEEELLIV